MGNIFIENENDNDISLHYYCLNCYKSNRNHVQLGSNISHVDVPCKTIKGDCLVFNRCTNINKRTQTISCDFFTTPYYEFTLLNIDDGISAKNVEIYCVFCQVDLGWYCVSSDIYPLYQGLFYIKSNLVL